MRTKKKIIIPIIVLVLVALIAIILFVGKDEPEISTNNNAQTTETMSQEETTKDTTEDILAVLSSADEYVQLMEECINTAFAGLPGEELAQLVTQTDMNLDILAQNLSAIEDNGQGLKDTITQYIADCREICQSLEGALQKNNTKKLEKLQKEIETLKKRAEEIGK